ncbi:hypothetical protein DPMN_171699 [Dreissena polymorpha]|uniref:Uncharacterized protein n=1 Tax=Dreissena polymorpha TaxID=45954 RepID=A0A9D4DYG8_DREPO|nr:hypothetical protein DPMN_171699 [Dreissena polymorpha]
MFTNVIKALCSETIARTNGHPLAEYFVIKDNGNLGTDTEDPTYQATGISEVDWKKDKKTDPTISRIYHIIDNILRKESKVIQMYIRHRRSFTIKDGIIYRQCQIDGQDVWQLVLPYSYRDWVMK